MNGNAGLPHTLFSPGSPGEGPVLLMLRPSCSGRAGRAHLWAGVYLETPKSHMGPHVWGRGGRRVQGCGSIGHLGLGLGVSLGFPEWCLPPAGKGTGPPWSSQMLGSNLEGTLLLGSSLH